MPVSSSVHPVFLVDASIYIFQAHFSPYVECRNRAGDDLSAVYGFIQFLLQFLRRARPETVAVAHDESLFCGFRHKLCPNYKSNRELPDENLAMQLQACREACEILGLAAFSSKVYEADDIIGVLAESIRKELGEDSVAVNIVTKDKDLAQLLQADADCLWEFSANQKRHILDIEKDFGVQPWQIADYLALTGDAVDCISGVPGVGPVKARELLQRFGDLEGIYQKLAEVPDLPLRGAKRLASLLLEHQDQARLCKELATIVREVNDEAEDFSAVSKIDLQVTMPDLDELRGFLVEYQFDSEESSRIVNQASRLVQD